MDNRVIANVDLEKKEKIFGTRVPQKNFQGTRVPENNFFFFNFQFYITQLSKNRFSKLGHFAGKFWRNEQMPILAPYLPKKYTYTT